MVTNTESVRKILILTAIPDGLRLDKEVRLIEDAIRRAIHREQFETRIRMAVRSQDIRRALAEERPHIVHFCGHGTPDGCLVLEDDAGNHKPVPPQGLAALFKLHAEYVNCVVLNACYSEKPALEISQYINYAIGMNQPIGDKPAIVFAQGFYDGLGYDNEDNIIRAYDEGLVAIQIEDSSSESIPVLKRKAYWSDSIPDNSTTEPTTIYIERPPIEEKCYQAILQPGALIRIKAPQRMGKTLLSEKLLDYARGQGYKTAKLDLKLADEYTLENLKNFLQWLCVDVSDSLELEVKLEKYWQDIYGLNKNCTRYFQKYLLSVLETPLVFAIDNFERLFEHPEIFPQFCLLLRSWYENAKQGDRVGNIWKKLRLVVVHSTEAYPTLDTNHSPFNVGIPMELPEFNQQQVEVLAKEYGVGKQGLTQLMDLLGGHPYLIQQALANLKAQQVTLEDLMNLAPTEQGIFSDHLRQQLWHLQHNPQLEQAYQKVVTANEPVRLDAEVGFKLHSLGLVKLKGNDCIPSYDLYRKYFSERLG
ncbi:MAG: AAA-like domain-containing protein [Scytonema sp. PMC 1069.18]|nr:AAA-like domain-containing protein [Scytonema sp. PMC 1069.18]MEC4881134.1 AAA-like domain-containing protein [Scytonema sp. PMC 1070.18]